MASTGFTMHDFSMGTIEVDPMTIRAEGAPEYPFLIIHAKLFLKEVKLTRREVPHFNVLSLQTSLFIGQQYRRIADSNIIFNPIEYRNRDTERHFLLEFPLDFNRIKVIEASRNGDMSLKLDFRFIIARQQPLNVPNGQRQDTQYFLTGFEDKTESLSFAVPQSYWVKNVLPSLSLNKFYLLEIPEGNVTIQEAWNYVEKAEAAFRNWNSKEVFANCREVGTLLDRLLKLKFGNDFNYVERWGRAYDKFNALASLDLHLEDLKKSPKYSPDSIKTNKIDAEQLIIRTKILIKYAGELLGE